VKKKVGKEGAIKKVTEKGEKAIKTETHKRRQRDK
jgi:hypothetical protein